MAINTNSVVELIGVPGRGFRWATYSGLFQQWERNDAGTKYQSDAGYPIPWEYQTKSFDVPRSKIDGFAMYVTNKLASESPAVNAYPIVIAVTCEDKKGGTQNYSYSRPAEQQNLATPVYDTYHLIDFATLPAIRFSFSFSAQNSAQEIEIATATLDPVYGGLGN